MVPVRHHVTLAPSGWIGGVVKHNMIAVLSRVRPQSIPLVHGRAGLSMQVDDCRRNRPGRIPSGQYHNIMPQPLVVAQLLGQSPQCSAHLSQLRPASAALNFS
jgi:hypothetical protein